MGNSLRCCLACMLPCGALDLIRIVHLNGHVEEISHPLTAWEVLQANPGHVLSSPCSEQGVARRVSPDSELKRGTIYFLIPEDGSVRSPKSTKSRQQERRSERKTWLLDEHRRKRRKERRGGVTMWRPHLESISED